MPLRVGEMMVVVRAQDFASRTLRRVSSDLSHMSRDQAIAARRAQIAFQKETALSRVAMAESNARRINYVRNGIEIERSLKKQVEAMDRLSIAQSQVMKGGRFRGGISRTQMREWQNASKAVKDLGLQGVMASSRLSTARTELDRLLSMKRPGKANVAAATAELRNAERAMKSLGAQGEAEVARWNRMQRAAANFSSRIDTMPTSLRRAALGIGNLGTALHRSNDELRRAYFNLDQATRAEIAFNQAMARMPAARLHEFGQALGGIGRTMQLFGAIGTAGFGLAAREAANFSKSVSLATTQMNRISASQAEAQANAARLRVEILRLTKEYPFAAEEMAQATYEIFSSTNIQRIDQGMALLEGIARVAVAGQTDLQTASKATITVLNTFKGAGDDVASIFNRMFSIIRYGRMQFDDFAAMLPKVAAAAYASGQRLDDVAGIMAFLTRKTGDARVAATQISRAFDVLTRKEFRNGIKRLGVDIEDTTGKMLPLPQVLARIWAKWGKELSQGGRASERFIQIVTRAADETTKGLLSTQEARRFFRFLFSDYREYANLQKLVTKNNTQFRNQFNQMIQDPGVQWAIFVARIRAGIIEIGQAAIPVFADLGRIVAGFIDKWESLSDGTRGMVVRWGVFISVGGLVAGVLLSITGALISVGLTFGSAAAKLARFMAAIFGLSNLLGGKGTAGVIGRALLLAKVLGFLAAIGTISIGVKLEMKGGGWSFVGKVLQIGGMNQLLKKAGMKSLRGRTGISAVLTELIWPEGTTRSTAEDVLGRIQELDKTLAGKMKQAKINKIQKEASNIFRAGLNVQGPGGEGRGFEFAKKKLDAYFKSLGLAPLEAAKNTETASDRFDAFLRNLNRSMGKAGTNQFLKKMGLDKQSLAQLDSSFDQADDKVHRLARSIGQAFDRGNVSQAARMLNMFTAVQTQKLTSNNILKLIAASVRSGDLNRATELLQQWQQAVQQGDQEMQQYRESMKQYSQQLAETSKQAAVDVVSNLRSMYQQMQQENETAFGELFKGPFLTSQTFDLAKEWGIAPRIQDMIKDLNQQNNQFTKWRRSLDAILKRGLPKEFVDQIRQMGPEEGQAFLDNILKAKPGQVNALITQWRRRNVQIQNATKMDFKSEIDHFRRAGVSMGEAIINGFQQAQTAKWFDNWVKVTFPGVINNAVNTAVQDWKATNPPPTRPTVPGSVPGGGTKPQRTAGVSNTSHNTDNSKRWDVTVTLPSVPHTEGYGAAYQQHKDDMRRAALALRTILRGLH